MEMLTDGGEELGMGIEGVIYLRFDQQFLGPTLASWLSILIPSTLLTPALTKARSPLPLLPVARDSLNSPIRMLNILQSRYLLPNPHSKEAHHSPAQSFPKFKSPTSGG